MIKALTWVGVFIFTAMLFMMFGCEKKSAPYEEKIEVIVLIPQESQHFEKAQRLLIELAAIGITHESEDDEDQEQGRRVTLFWRKWGTLAELEPHMAAIRAKLRMLAEHYPSLMGVKN